MAIESTPHSLVDTSAGTIVATVEIAVPRQRVFQALSSAEVVDWWGDSSAYRTTRWQGDVRVGGSYRVDGESADGSAFYVSGEYLEVDPPNKLVHTWKADWSGMPATVVAYQLEATPAGTRVTVRHTGFAGHGEECANHGLGWERVLGWLQRHLASAPNN